jgi:hypothetical protein
LQQAPERLEDDSDQGRSEERDRRVIRGLEQRANIPDEQDIQANHTGGKHDIDQRALNDEVNVPQAIANDGCTNCKPKAEHKHERYGKQRKQHW